MTADLLRMLAHRARCFPNYPMGYHMPEVFAAIGEQPPEPAPAEGDGRAAFEAWAKSHGGLDVVRVNSGERGAHELWPCTYYQRETEIAWRAWANKPQPKGTATGSIALGSLDLAAAELAGTADEEPKSLPASIKRAFGLLLKWTRCDRQLGIGEAADELGMTSAYLSQLERGRKPLTPRTAEVIRAWAQALAPVPWSAAPSTAPAPEVPDGYKLVLVPDESPEGEPDWEEVRRQAEVATGIKVERNTFSIVIREVRRWLAHRATTPTLIYSPIEVNSHSVEMGREHPNNCETPDDDRCKYLDLRGDDKGQGLSVYWKWGHAAGWNDHKKHVAAQAPAVAPEGFVLVPAEPTPEMLHAMCWGRDAARMPLGSSDRRVADDDPIPYFGSSLARRAYLDALAAFKPPVQGKQS